MYTDHPLPKPWSAVATAESNTVAANPDIKQVKIRLNNSTAATTDSQIKAVLYLQKGRMLVNKITGGTPARHRSNTSQRRKKKKIAKAVLLLKALLTINNQDNDEFPEASWCYQQQAAYRWPIRRLCVPLPGALSVRTVSASGGSTSPRPLKDTATAATVYDRHRRCHNSSSGLSSI